MVGFILLSRSYYYLRRRSPGPPFPPDHRQAGERGPISITERVCLGLKVDRPISGCQQRASPSMAPSIEAVQQPTVSLEGSVGDATAFWCHEHAGASGLLATVGIFSYEPRVSMRSAIRSSWLSSMSPSFAAHFVLRGRDMWNAATVNGEAAEHRDMLFLNASSLLGRTAGPLMSLISWFGCSLRAFPKVSFVGKCDDDMWMHMFGMESLLWRVLGLRKADGVMAGEHSNGLLNGLLGSGLHASTPDQTTELVVGRFERFTWFQNQSHPGHEGPVPAGFSKNPLGRGAHCQPNARAQNTTSFPFPKGAIFFLSGGAVQNILGAMRPHALQLVATDATRCFRYSALWRADRQSVAKKAPRRCGGLIDVLPPYEDVWTGFALDHLSKTRILAVDIQGAFQDSYGFMAGQATLAWHSRVDTAFSTRARLLHNWSAPMFCNGTRHRIECGHAMPACHGDHKWHYCRVKAPHGCDIKQYDLYTILYRKWGASNPNFLRRTAALLRNRTHGPRGSQDSTQLEAGCEPQG